jgi:intron-binding protein aquarius
MYMRLLGYSKDSIAILTTYNRQKALIKEVLRRRCSNPLFGLARVETVDAFQGQQSDYVLLSLVRTRNVGHLRDPRRMVVALSRARLGLYVFCRDALFAQVAALGPAFSLLRHGPLHLVVGETYHPQGQPQAQGQGQGQERVVHSVSNVTDMGILVYQLVQQTQAQAQA